MQQQQLEAPDEPEGEFDANDPKQVNNRKRRAKQRAADDDQTVKDLLSSSRGRAWLWRLLGTCHIFGISFRADPYQTAFNEGERNVGNRLLAQIMRVDSAAYVLMMRENSNG